MMTSEDPTDIKSVLDALNNSRNLTHWHKPPKEFGPDNPEYSDYNRNDLTDPGDLSLISFTEEFAFGEDSSGEDTADGNTEEEKEDEEQPIVDDVPPVVVASQDWMDPAEEFKEKDRHPSLQIAEIARHQNFVLMKIEELHLDRECKKASDQKVVAHYQKYQLQLKEIKRQHRLQYQQYCKERDENLQMEERRLQKQEEEIRLAIQQKDLEYDKYIEQKSSELNQLIEIAERKEIEHRNVIEGLVNDLHALKSTYIEKHEEMKQLLSELNGDQSLNVTVENMKSEALKPVDDMLELVTKEAQTREELTEVKTNIEMNLNYVDGLVQALVLKKEKQAQQETERASYEESQAKLKAEQEKQALAMENELRQANQQAAAKGEAAEENRQAAIITLGRKRYEELQNKMENNISSLSALSNEKKKEVGWIFTTINQLDSTNQNVNREKLQKLIAYLSGRNVQHNKKVYCTNNDQLTTAYVKFKLIKDMVKVALDTQGKETGGIAAYAWLIVSLISVFPDLWEIFLYHMYTTCPFLVPLFIYQKEGQSSEDYDKERGKRPKEGFDLYLTRMGNAALLFGLVLAKMCKKSEMPEEAPVVGWKFIAGLLMLDPSPGTSAEVLRQFLEGVGSELQQSYGKQFAKLMDYATGSYWTQLEEITNIAKEGDSSKNQLQQLFEEYKKMRKLKPNEHINRYN